MLTRDDLDTLQKNTPGWGRIKIRDDLPPSEHDDDARCIGGYELRQWLVDIGARVLTGEFSPKVMILTGFDIVDDLSLNAYDGGTLSPSVRFEKCRFRGSLTVDSPAGLTDLGVSDSVVEKDLVLCDCDALGEVHIGKTEIGSIRFDRVTAQKIGLAGLDLGPGGKIRIGDCQVELLSLIGTFGDEVVIEKDEKCSFGTVNLWNHRVTYTTLEGMTVHNKLSISGSPILKRLQIGELVAEGSVDINVSNAPADANYVLDHCKIATDLRISGSVNPDNPPAQFSINFCEIGVDLTARSLRSAGLSLFKTRVVQDASFMDCAINQLDMSDCQVEKDLRIVDTQFDGPASLNEVTVGRRLEFYKVKQSAGFQETPEGARSSHVLVARKSGFGDVAWTQCQLGFKGGFTNCDILKNLRLIDCTSKELEFDNVTIAGDAAFSGSTFGSLAFEDSAARSLTFTGQYDENSVPAPLATHRLSLHGSQLNRLHFDSYRHRDNPIAFLPHFVDMGGAVYESLPTVGMDRDAKQLLAFRKRLVSGGYDTGHDPQPYFQLARQLRTSGYLTEANRFQFFEREAARQDARRTGNLGQFLWLSVLRWFIGYGIGYGYFWAFGWVFLFTLLGALFLGSTHVPGGPVTSWLWRLGASFDQVLPVAKLSPHYTDFFQEKNGNPLNYWQNAYFSFHRFMGWLLATFVVAGLAGLTQKPS